MPVGLADDAPMGMLCIFLFSFCKTLFLVRHLFVSGSTGRHRWPCLGSHRCCVLEYPSRAWVCAVHVRFLLYCVRGGYPLEVKMYTRWLNYKNKWRASREREKRKKV